MGHGCIRLLPLANIRRSEPQCLVKLRSSIVLLVGGIEARRTFFARGGNAFLEIFGMAHGGNAPEAQVHRTDEIEVPALSQLLLGGLERESRIGGDARR